MADTVTLSKTPVFVLTGFLGSGKTTVLNRCLADPRFGDSAVLINEFGETRLDHLLVENVDDEVVILESGCVCCDIRDDFTSALLTLASRRGRSEIPVFRRVVLETTGIANPDAIHQVLLNDPEVREHYYHAGTVTVVDACFGPHTLDSHAEAVLQVAVAGRLLISKTDIATADDIESLRNRLVVLNPAALAAECSDLAHALDDVARDTAEPVRAATGVPGLDMPRAGHVQGFRTFRLSYAQALAREDLHGWLKALLFAQGDRIYRIKGWVDVVGERLPVVVHSVRHALYPEQRLERWPRDTRSTELTFICRDLTHSAAIRSLQQVVARDGQCLPGKSAPPNCPDPGVVAQRPDRVDLPRLARQVAELLAPLLASRTRRPWHRWQLHNPWSLAATIIDSWALLSVCQQPGLLDAVEKVIGPDIVLFEMQLCSISVRDADVGWKSEAALFPVEPWAGAVVRLPLAPMSEMEFCVLDLPDGACRLSAPKGQFIVHSAGQSHMYRNTEGDEQFELLIFYFPASSRYSRNPADPLHRSLIELMPLRNSVSVPLWLVRGEDRADNDFVTGFRVTPAYWTG